MATRAESLVAQLHGADPHLPATTEAVQELSDLCVEPGKDKEFLEAGAVGPLVKLLSAGAKLEVTENAAYALQHLCCD